MLKVTVILLFLFCPSIGWAASGEVVNLFAQAFNFLALCALLYLFARKPVREYFERRQREIKEGIEEANRVKEEARQVFEAYQKKYDQLAEEIREISEYYRQEGETEKERILSEAKIQAAKIKADAQLFLQIELRKAKGLLTAKLITAAMAEAINRISQSLDPAAKDLIFSQYLQKIEKFERRKQP